MKFTWPDSFLRYRDEPWATADLETLALKYDSVEQHGWYNNLDLSVEQITAGLEDGEVLIDYSGGTGILLDRIFARKPEIECGVIIADSSPKFLRLALSKFTDDSRVAFRLIHYLKSERRLQTLDEALGESASSFRADALCSTNAIHLYYGLDRTLASWRDVLRSGGRIFVQSGNIRDPGAAPGTWIIDETVEHIHEAALGLVATEPEYADLRARLKDADYMAAHDTLRKKYFLPVRPLSLYAEAIEGAGFEIIDTQSRSIAARVDEWHSFLAVYHEGVLGWLGGAQKVTGVPVDEATIARRKSLMRRAMDVIFEGRESFDANWTYIRAKKST
jgi:SAM-dependent methyltransferase